MRGQTDALSVTIIPTKGENKELSNMILYNVTWTFKTSHPIQNLTYILKKITIQIYIIIQKIFVNVYFIICIVQYPIPALHANLTDFYTEFSHY